MKKIFIFLTCIIYLSEINANEPIDKESKVISEIFETTNTENYMSTVEEIMKNNIKQLNYSPQLEKIFIQETQKLIQEEFYGKNFLLNIYQEVYKKHFNLQELEQILAWHTSSAGKKYIAIGPQLTLDILAATEKFWTKNSAKLERRIRRRLGN
tara:strand:- start:259 stop:720 length:462 start_codon:yes stop_codon:yes gene_type:complete